MLKNVVNGVKLTKLKYEASAALLLKQIKE
jgi:hypothetical protein